MAKMLEKCRVAPPPPPSTPVELSLPLSFLDVVWVNFKPMPFLYFYEFPCSRTYFIETIIPKIKDSLSLALRHFPILAGHLVYPLSSSMPKLRYVTGDSVSVVFAESDDDLGYLTDNRSHDAVKFYPFVPPPPLVTDVAGSRLIPVFAVQVTLFPNFGMSLGTTEHHVVWDARANEYFKRAWTSICKLGGDEQFVVSRSLPTLDRSIIKDPHGRAERSWNHRRIIQKEPEPYDPLVPAKSKVRATFMMEEAKIKKLKNLIDANRSNSRPPSAYLVTCAYVWSCLVRSGATIGEEDGTEYFLGMADLRSYFDPPVPDTYFGNCVGPWFVSSPRALLIGDDGFLVAAKLIGDEIHERVDNRKVLDGADMWLSRVREMDPSRIFAAMGSPRSDLYDVDFGWGKPKKFELLTIDLTGAMSLTKARNCERDLEIGLSLPKIKMEAFASIFINGFSPNLRHCW